MLGVQTQDMQINDQIARREMTDQIVGRKIAGREDTRHNNARFVKVTSGWTRHKCMETSYSDSRFLEDVKVTSYWFYNAQQIIKRAHKLGLKDDCVRK